MSDTPEKTPGANTDGPLGEPVPDRPSKYTTEPTALTWEEMLRKTLNPSAESTTKQGTVWFSGNEPLSSVLDLELEPFLMWVAARIKRFQQATVDFAQAAVGTKEEKKGRTIAESEWDAIIATGGLTKSFPLEAPIISKIVEFKIAGYFTDEGE